MTQTEYSRIIATEKLRHDLAESINNSGLMAFDALNVVESITLELREIINKEIANLQTSIEETVPVEEVKEEVNE